MHCLVKQLGNLAKAVLRAAHYAKISVCPVEEMVTEIGRGVRAKVQGRLVEVGSGCLAGGDIPEILCSNLENIKENGTTPLLVYEEGRALGVISVADHIRPTARKVVQDLRSLGIKKIGLPFLVQLSRRTLKTITWNIAFGLIFNAVAVLASGGGFLTPIMGALVHNIGSVLVVLSSASLVFASEKDRQLSL